MVMLMLFRQVGTIALTRFYTKHVETVGSAKAKEVAGKVAQVFGEILPQMDSLATKFHVDFPIRGVELYSTETATAATPAAPVAEADTAAHDSAVDAEPVVLAKHADVYSDDAYLQHIQHQVAVVKEQFRRLSRNTNKELRDFAQGKAETIAELYTAVGGKEDAHAHH